MGDGVAGWLFYIGNHLHFFFRAGEQVGGGFGAAVGDASHRECDDDDCGTCHR